MIREYIDSFSTILNSTVITDASGHTMADKDGYGRVIDQLLAMKNNNGTLFLVGNGGSSAIVSHAAIDFINMCKLRAFPITDNSILTCMANDYGYEEVFRQPLEIMMNENDAVLAVSSSGKSPNIVNATNKAKERGAFAVTFSGFKADNPLRSSGDYNFWLDADNYGKVEIGHALLIHILSDELCKHV